MYLTRFVPAVGWLRRYRRAALRPDLLAGLTAAAVVVPKAMAYATIAGLPVAVGLYTAIVPGLVYALLGTSRPLSVSTTTTIAILTAAELGRAAPGGDAVALLAAATTLAALVGVLLLLAAVLRLGFVANFISEPVLTGFKTGIGLVIVVDQLPKLFGVHIEKAGFFRDLASLVQALPQTSAVTLALAAALLLLIFALERFAPRAPAPLLAVAAAIAASALLALPVATVGTVAGGWPPLTLPQPALFADMWPAAAGIALMSFTESIAAARAFGSPQEPRPEPNQELRALGAANLLGGCFGAMPAGGGTTQTAVNRKAGAQTQMAAIVAALAAAAVLGLLGPAIALMPQAALAAVVVAYSVDLIRPGEFAAIRRVRHVEFRWALIAALGVMVLGTLKGIVVAVIVSLLSLAQQAYRPPVYALARERASGAFRPLDPAHADDETWPGLLPVRVEGRLFFANVQSVAERIAELVAAHRPRVLVLDGRALLDLEYTALKMLDEAERKLADRGVTLWLAALNPATRDLLLRSPLGERLGGERLFPTLTVAVTHYQALPAADARP